MTETLKTENLTAVNNAVNTSVQSLYVNGRVSRNTRNRIDHQVVTALAGVGCTDTEIANEVGCTVYWLRHTLKTAIEKGRGRGKTSLRRLQWKKASEGNVIMLIWLGKQYLGQSDYAGQGKMLKHVGGKVILDFGQPDKPGGEGKAAESVEPKVEIVKLNAV